MEHDFRDLTVNSDNTALEEDHFDQAARQF